MHEYYFYYKEESLHVAPIHKAPAIGTLIDFKNYHLCDQLPGVLFKVISEPVLTVPSTVYYINRDQGWTGDIESFRIDVEKIK